jgi:hypothetical protein
MATGVLSFLDAGAVLDSDRAKKPPLAEPSATDQELKPGDRVEGLGDFEKPTGEFGTVPRNGHVREVPISFHVIGLWINVDKMLAPSRETVKI